MNVAFSFTLKGHFLHIKFSDTFELKQIENICFTSILSREYIAKFSSLFKYSSRVVFLFLNGTKIYFIFMFGGHSKSTSDGKRETGLMKKVTKSDNGGETVVKKVMSLT